MVYGDWLADRRRMGPLRLASVVMPFYPPARERQWIRERRSPSGVTDAGDRARDSASAELGVCWTRRCINSMGARPRRRERESAESWGVFATLAVVNASARRGVCDEVQQGPPSVDWRGGRYGEGMQTPCDMPTFRSDPDIFPSAFWQLYLSPGLIRERGFDRHEWIFAVSKGSRLQDSRFDLAPQRHIDALFTRVDPQ